MMQPLVVLVSGLILWLASTLIKRKKHKLPPGPRGLPLLGNIFDVPSSFQWLTYQKMGQEYGMRLYVTALFMLYHDVPL